MFSLTLQCKHLNHDPPNGLHRHCDETDDRVGESEVENQEVDICATLHLVPAICFYITFDWSVSGSEAIWCSDTHILEQFGAPPKRWVATQC